MRYLVVIPARGGSKGIPHKNIYKIKGKTLLQYAIDCIKGVEFDGDIAVSTDDDQIAFEALKNDNIYVINRPADISGDCAKTEDALLHALDYMEKLNSCEYDAVVTLQATSPLRTSKSVKEFLQFYEKNKDEYDALLTLNEDRSDFWILKTADEYCRLYPNAPRRRQERKPLYVENSAIYVTNSTSLRETKSVLGNKVNGFVIDPIEAVDINEWLDIFIVNGIMDYKEQEKK